MTVKQTKKTFFSSTPNKKKGYEKERGEKGLRRSRLEVK